MYWSSFTSTVTTAWNDPKPTTNIRVWKPIKNSYLMWTDSYRYHNFFFVFIMLTALSASSTSKTMKYEISHEKRKFNGFSYWIAISTATMEVNRVIQCSELKWPSILIHESFLKISNWVVRRNEMYLFVQCATPNYTPYCLCLFSRLINKTCPDWNYSIWSQTTHKSMTWFWFLLFVSRQFLRNKERKRFV